MTTQATPDARDAGATLHLGGNAWCSPDLEPLLVPIDTVSTYPGNARRHDQDAINGSLADLGCWRACVAQRSTGHVLVGNGQLRGLLDLGAERVPITWRDCTDTLARAIVVRDNLTGDLASNDDTALLALLAASAAEDALPITGFSDSLLAELEAAASAEPDGEEADNRAPTTGERLTMVDVTWGDPHHKVHHGEVWRLGRHTLVIAKLHTEHPAWAPLLTDDTVFAPYPEPYITTSELAADRPLLLVQPNVYLAGHLMDKHASAFPEDTIRKQDA